MDPREYSLWLGDTVAGMNGVDASGAALAIAVAGSFAASYMTLQTLVHRKTTRASAYGRLAVAGQIAGMASYCLMQVVGLLGLAETFLSFLEPTVILHAVLLLACYGLVLAYRDLPKGSHWKQITSRKVGIVLAASFATASFIATCRICGLIGTRAPWGLCDYALAIVCLLSLFISGPLVRKVVGKYNSWASNNDKERQYKRRENASRLLSPAKGTITLLIALEIALHGMAVLSVRSGPVPFASFVQDNYPANVAKREVYCNLMLKVVGEVRYRAADGQETGLDGQDANSADASRPYALFANGYDADGQVTAYLCYSINSGKLPPLYLIGRADLSSVEDHVNLLRNLAPGISSQGIEDGARVTACRRADSEENAAWRYDIYDLESGRRLETQYFNDSDDGGLELVRCYAFYWDQARSGSWLYKGYREFDASGAVTQSLSISYDGNGNKLAEETYAGNGKTLIKREVFNPLGDHITEYEANSN